MSVLGGGCAVVGPSSISNGRLVYSEVINYTADQEILNIIVRERYAQTFGMLNVASVTANVKFTASAGAEFQAWESDPKTDALVPLSVGLAYEENPTISYIPVQGESTMRRMVMPITIEEGFVVMGAAAEWDVAARMLFRSVNGLQNPMGSPPSPEFERFIDLYVELRHAGVLNFGRTAAAQYFTSLSNYGVEHADDVRALLEILGIKGKTVDGREILLPFYMSSGKRETDAINVQTTSALDWIRHGGSMIEVPASHLEAGIVEPSGWEGSAENRFITIRSSKTRPKNAVVAVSFRGWWFYIDATDTRSKQSFRLIKFLVRFRLDLDRGEQQVPVLTIPVG
jgi:hypothetical protein